MSNEPTAISRPRPQLLIPGYHLVELIGKGGMGEVHRAIQLSLGRTVAVKLLSANLSHDESFVARFEKEAAALAALSHPNIVSIVDKGSSGNTWFLVMEYVDGPSLREEMKKGLDAPRALRIALDVCKAIDYAHNRGVIHRDLKPENILFDQQAGGIPKVSDFGLAGFMDGGDARFNLTQTHVGMGTLAYMAPEQSTNAKTADHRADIYSLGVMIYELLVGELPVGTFSPPSHHKPGLDKRLDGLVARCLKPAPADRYGSVAELISDLEPLVPVSALRTLPPQSVGPVRRTWEKTKRGLRVAARTAEIALVVSAVVVIGVVALRVHFPGPPKLALADVLTREVDAAGAITPPGRISQGAQGYKVTLGEGPDALPLEAWGRGAHFEDGALAFAPMRLPLLPSSNPARSNFGRLRLDLPDRSGDEARTSAELRVGPTDPGVLGRLRDLTLGVRREPRAALVLAGEPGRYVALTVSGAGEPITFEWALQDRRGTMLGPPSPQDGVVPLALSVDAKGELRAFLGSGADKRPVGEPVQLGAGWRRYFGRFPAVELACVDGECQAQKLVLESPAPAEPPAAVAAAAPNDGAAAKPLASPLAPTAAATGPVKPTATKSQVASAAVHPKEAARPATTVPASASRPAATAHKPVATKPAPPAPKKSILPQFFPAAKPAPKKR